ncbi:MAG: hypothetical protein HYR80_00450 [Nitrospirae bacterium]|nr:hypothetical protein [Nitrospirota bacterium]
MSLEYYEINPEKGIPLGCLVFIHGLGVNGKDLMPLAAQLNLPHTKFVFPNAPFSVDYSYEGRAWFQIPANQIIIGGFSQGAVMSLEAGLRYPNKICGIIALSGYLHAPEQISIEKNQANQGIPVLVCHGEEDDVLPIEGSREAVRYLEKEGYSVSFHEYPIGHQVIPEELIVIRQFILDSLQQALFPAK